MKTKQVFKSRGEFVSVAHKVDQKEGLYELTFVDEGGECVILSLHQLQRIMICAKDNMDEILSEQYLGY